ncbi:oxygenase MpaB family protein [Mucilaginibacter lacusdianchii]|uniref:oxygenase MpaB family protein n=1 Tax=Mucilaginibacter lacusdianchii TaxID=2684211 RepID=UPI00131ABD1A|nr:oxygenase MpaB family protein [Mucilaginibacter sp. JXJ CY 39]
MKSAHFYTSDFLSEKRNIADSAADEFVIQHFSDSATKITLQSWLGGLTYNYQLQDIPADYQNKPLLVQATQIPDFADVKQMHRGAAFFARHASLIMNMLGLLSLPYCYAAADGARVLYLSERMRSDVGKRLQETGDFVWDVMDPNAFEFNGRGFVSILKVRIMHAAVRYYTSQSGKWNMAWGVPVNQEDMAGTNLSFSLIVIRGLRKLDVAVTYEDQQAFMHLWNVVGSMLGIQAVLLPQDGRQALELEQAIRQRQFKSSKQGSELTKALIDYFKSVSNQTGLIPTDTIQLMRYLLGDEVANVLDIPKGSVSAVIINALKFAGSLQQLQPQWSVSRAYQSQYADFKKQQAGLKA